MSDPLSIARPLKRALRGFMSLLGGEIEATSPESQQLFFEKLAVTEKSSDGHGFNRFQRMLRRVRNLHDYSPVRTPKSPLGTFGGRPIIGESTPINGGIYLGVTPQEAIVVDDKHGGLERLYKELVVRLSEVSLDRALEEKEILPEVAALVAKHLKFNERAVTAACEREGVQADEKVAIDMFLYEGVGAARHQVLTAAYLIERLKVRNLLQGCVSIESTSTHLMGGDERLTYTSPRGYLFIFDPLKQQNR
ncbi:MAG: hypothetical protein J0M12_09015 [Deltaproteobacteria bacterium]|nr:hypothetical protein [Deltaproteobacteria bacterium]